MHPKTSPSPHPKPEKRKDLEDDQIEPKFPKRRRLVNDDGHQSPPPEAGPSRITLEINATTQDPIDPSPTETRSTPKVAADLKSTLRTMVEGKLSYSYKEKQLDNYLALHCEMVGIGYRGRQSSVARVSVVNYRGAVQLDEFVQQREPVVDYRTKYSGIRKPDLVKAKSFDDVQGRVAALLKDRVLVGHAVYNDLKALSLTHPYSRTLDTQSYAWRHKVAGTKHIALRDLVKQELGITIQQGEHSSVTDVRAAMAVFRLHEREWEGRLRPCESLKRRRARDLRMERAAKKNKRQRVLDELKPVVNWEWDEPGPQFGSEWDW